MLLVQISAACRLGSTKKWMQAPIIGKTFRIINFRSIYELFDSPGLAPFSFSLGLDQMKTQTPLDLNELRQKSVEQDRIILDLDAVAESFRKAEIESLNQKA